MNKKTTRKLRAYASAWCLKNRSEINPHLFTEFRDKLVEQLKKGYLSGHPDIDLSMVKRANWNLGGKAVRGIV